MVPVAQLVNRKGAAAVAIKVNLRLQVTLLGRVNKVPSKFSNKDLDYGWLLV